MESSTALAEENFGNYDAAGWIAATGAVAAGAYSADSMDHWRRSSVKNLNEFGKKTSNAEMEVALAALGAKWIDERSISQANYESVSASEAGKLGVADTLAPQKWKATWRTIGGENCPICQSLDGKTTLGEAFLAEGEEISGEDFVSVAGIKHPPAHRGCDCTMDVGPLE